MIGVYDSGVGGLTVLRALRRTAPSCDIVYLGDTARVPYGGKDDSTVCRYAEEALSYLSSLSPSLVLVACGTVSTVFLPRAGGRCAFPLLGVAEAGARAAAKAAPEGRIAVLGTEATVRSGFFPARLAELAPAASVTVLPCPLFVALAEGGFVGKDDSIAALVTERLLAPLSASPPDAILLGCTHFPWLSPHIAALFPRARLIDCGEAVAEELAPLLKGERGRGETTYLVTDGRESFLRAVERMTGRLPDGTVREISL